LKIEFRPQSLYNEQAKSLINTFTHNFLKLWGKNFLFRSTRLFEPCRVHLRFQISFLLNIGASLSPIRA